MWLNRKPLLNFVPARALGPRMSIYNMGGGGEAVICRVPYLLERAHPSNKRRIEEQDY